MKKTDLVRSLRSIQATLKETPDGNGRLSIYNTKPNGESTLAALEMQKSVINTIEGIVNELDAEKSPTVVIYLDGGLVQWVISDLPVEPIVLDGDMPDFFDKKDEEDLIPVHFTDGIHKVFGGFRETDTKPEFVAQIAEDVAATK